MPWRKASLKLSEQLYHAGHTEPYPTRALEFFMAMVTLSWCLPVLIDPGILANSVAYRFLLALLPASTYGVIGTTLATFRVIALIRNGAWKRSPGLRFAGALVGAQWWTVITACYIEAMLTGAKQLPLFYVFPIFALAEYHCLMRCAADLHSAYMVPKLNSRPGLAGNGRS